MSVDHSIHKEELDVYGASRLGRVLSDDRVAELRDAVLAQTRADEQQYGRDVLIEQGLYESVLDLARLGGPFLDLVDNEVVNDVVDVALNEKATIYSYNALVNKPDARSTMVGFKWHRDQPPFGETRTSLIFMIPLVDYSPANGSTEYVPGTHRFIEYPSEEFLERHKVAAEGSAGDGYVVDAALLHRAGRNEAKEPRPMVAMKFILAPFKQQVDFVSSAAEHLSGASDRVRRRLGYDTRVARHQDDLRLPAEERRWKSGQYEMTNTDMKDSRHWNLHDHG